METRSPANSSTGNGWAEAVREEQKRELKDRKKKNSMPGKGQRGQTTGESVVTGFLLQALTLAFMMRQHRLPQ